MLYYIHDCTDRYTLTGEERKTLASMLGKIFISSSYDGAKLGEVQELAEEVSNAKLFTDATSRNAVTKLITALAKAGAKKPADARGSEEGALEFEQEAEAGSDGIEENPDSKEPDALEDPEVEEATEMVSVIDEEDEGEDETDTL
jgi:hypothetical protein